MVIRMAQITNISDVVGGQVYFDAALTPHRSLSKFGFFLLMSTATIFGVAIGVAFLLAGAWPVIGFCGLELVVLYVAFRLNYRSGRWSERILLTDKGLLVNRYGPNDEVDQWSLEPSWLQVEMDDPPRQGSLLKLTSHGRSLVIGGFLTPAERLEVADALRDAITAYRKAPNLRSA